MEIHLLRHGKTAATEKRLYCGQTDLPLSESGVAELTLLKSQGIYPAPAALFFSSGLIRSEETVDIIYGRVQRKVLPNIAEYRFGIFEMRAYEELQERDDYRSWINDKSGNVSCPGGESRKQFEKRVIEGFGHIVNGLQAIGEASAFVSCHGGTIACIMEYLQPNAKDFYGWQPAPGRGYTLIYANGHLRELRNL